MKITIECESIEELRNFCFESGYLVSKDRIETAKAASKESNKFDENKQITLTASNPEEKPTAEELTESAKVTEAIIESAEKKIAKEKKVNIVDVRKMLSTANKVAKKNIAKDWIAEAGYQSLSDAEKDQETLKALMGKAEEVIFNAE